MAKSREAFRTISEVADALGTQPHVLRFWESKFTQIKPVKRAGGRRYYRPADMALLGGIKRLLHEDGLTIKGVQKILRERGVKYVAALAEDAPMIEEAEAEEVMAPDENVVPLRKSREEQAPESQIEEPGQAPEQDADLVEANSELVEPERDDQPGLPFDVAPPAPASSEAPVAEQKTPVEPTENPASTADSLKLLKELALAVSVKDHTPKSEISDALKRLSVLKDRLSQDRRG